MATADNWYWPPIHTHTCNSANFTDVERKYSFKGFGRAKINVRWARTPLATPWPGHVPLVDRINSSCLPGSVTQEPTSLFIQSDSSNSYPFQKTLRFTWILCSMPVQKKKLISKATNMGRNWILNCLDWIHICVIWN